jgi:hypothetical protein
MMMYFLKGLTCFILAYKAVSRLRLREGHFRIGDGVVSPWGRRALLRWGWRAQLHGRRGRPATHGTNKMSQKNNHGMLRQGSGHQGGHVIHYATKRDM